PSPPPSPLPPSFPWLPSERKNSLRRIPFLRPPSSKAPFLFRAREVSFRTVSFLGDCDDISAGSRENGDRIWPSSPAEEAPLCRREIPCLWRRPIPRREK